MNMITYELSYATLNSYNPPVRGGHFLFLLLPCESEGQSVHHLELTNSLQEKTCFLENAFGFTTVFLSTDQQFGHLELDMLCQVRKSESNPFDFINPLSVEEEYEILRNPSFRVDHRLFLGQTRLTSLPEGLIGSALPPIRADERVFDYLVDLNSALHQKMTFQAGFTNAQTTGREAWEAGKGVCQDYAHIFLGLLRAQGIPCRYVSGYLNQGESFVGDSQMHAWVEAKVPGLGWKGFDPSNDLLVDHHYIKVAHGVDYSDCGPIRGVLHSAKTQETVYRVQVVAQ